MHARMQIKKSQRWYISLIPREANSDPISTKFGSFAALLIPITRAEFCDDNFDSFQLPWGCNMPLSIEIVGDHYKG